MFYNIIKNKTVKKIDIHISYGNNKFVRYVIDLMDMSIYCNIIYRKETTHIYKYETLLKILGKCKCEFKNIPDIYNEIERFIYECYI